MSNRVPSDPLTFESVAPAVRDSRVAATIAAAWGWVLRAATASSTARAVHAASLELKSTPLELRVALTAWMIAIAAAAHLLLLVFVERYHFPRRTSLILPAVIVVVAATACIFSADIARALRDKRSD